MPLVNVLKKLKLLLSTEYSFDEKDKYYDCLSLFYVALRRIKRNSTSVEVLIVSAEQKGSWSVLTGHKMLE